MLILAIALIWCLASLEDNIVVRHLVNALKSPDEYDLFTFLNVGDRKLWQ